jgi:bla regulator protein blaR1
MTRLPLVLCLACAWFFATNALVSICIAGAERWLSAPGVRGCMERLSGNAALSVRLLPSILAAVFVGGVFVPSFLAHEPNTGPEAVGWVLFAVAGATLALCLAAIGRGATAMLRARTIVQGWMRSATPLALAGLSGTNVKAFAIDDGFPVVSLVGIWRPRLFIARQVLRALTPGELRVAVAHELAHRDAGDNGKRLLLCCSPDVLAWATAGRRLEQHWAADAECAADTRAAGHSRVRRVDLAGALVKVSRLAVAPNPSAPLFSTLHERGDVAARVGRLVTMEASGDRRRSSLPTAVGLLVAAAVVLLPLAWSSVHGVTEAFLRLLP